MQHAKQKWVAKELVRFLLTTSRAGEKNHMEVLY